MPSPERCLTALSPSFVSGHLTTTFFAISFSSLPSLTIPSKSVATTSRLTSPGTIEQISSTSGRKGRFSLAINDGLVVQPSTSPMATPSLSSVTLAVSRKIFMSCLLDALDLHLCPRAHFLENGRVAGKLAEDVDGAGGPDLLALARGRAAEEDAERGAGRPIGKVAQFDGGAGLFGLGVDGDL